VSKHKVINLDDSETKKRLEQLDAKIVTLSEKLDSVHINPISRLDWKTVFTVVTPILISLIIAVTVSYFALTTRMEVTEHKVKQNESDIFKQEGRSQESEERLRKLEVKIAPLLETKK